MSLILSHPFRLVGSTIGVIEQASEQAVTEQIAILLLTRRGERTLVPGFGITDPVFGRFDATEVQLGVSLFGPPVTITSVRRTVTGETTQEIEVQFGG